jgi:hypothetical protein
VDRCRRSRRQQEERTVVDGYVQEAQSGNPGVRPDGRGFVAAMRESELWEVAAVYDICGPARELARQQLPDAAIYDAPDAIFCDRSIDAVEWFTLADARPQPIRQALANRKHVLAEKPIGQDVATEWQWYAKLKPATDWWR